MRGAPAWHRQHSVQHPSTVSALRADPPSPPRGEGKNAPKALRLQFGVSYPIVRALVLPSGYCLA
ncbi:MAG: hypothetical protein EOS11_15240 [Mesorhizobium sp.]|nr:MAG: hypothetical protein EOR98_30180 [Mesorhizobium sp.]RWN57636.1 MAG: hypothetical protein EOS00_23425 [Mesorhizobium sp.]RWN71237.1 MAG: hypothetical protein EOS02_31405 [Mesorhizobium sp.]RWN71527.1 MAG: hypothetical protein EOS01_30860 [Mesorhizobium sp.]RWN85294.1 MAG: hypothetical protein EOS04_23840 [Mesorhizobium sp.]